MAEVSDTTMWKAGQISREKIVVPSPPLTVFSLPFERLLIPIQFHHEQDAFIIPLTDQLSNPSDRCSA